MMSGSICCRDKKIMLVSIMALAISALVYYWLKTPLTADALFRQKCANCHELQHARLCEFPREIRPLIVDVMRRQYGAADLIDEQEADLIKRYLEDELSCP
jgi:cytochrome c2